jgi:uncharacterized protein (TIGR02266 family)
MLGVGMAEARRHERRRHFRGKARPGRQIPVRFRRADVTEWTDAETRNIGVGGAFIATSPQQPVGTPLVVELVVPTADRKFELTALVRWIAEGAEGGVGVQFVDVDIDVLLDLNDYFASLTGKDL